MKRMDIVWVDLDAKGSIQGGRRPCLVVCNDMACRHSPTIVVVPITSKQKRNLPTHMHIMLNCPSTILFEQFLTVNKDQISETITTLSKNRQSEAEEKMKIALGLQSVYA